MEYCAIHFHLLFYQRNVQNKIFKTIFDVPEKMTDFSTYQSMIFWHISHYTPMNLTSTLKGTYTLFASLHFKINPYFLKLHQLRSFITSRFRFLVRNKLQYFDTYNISLYRHIFGVQKKIKKYRHIYFSVSSLLIWQNLNFMWPFKSHIWETTNRFKALNWCRG